MSSRTTRPAEKRARKRAQAEYRARIARLENGRRLAGLLAFIPLSASLGCAFVPLPVLCDVPRELYLGLWAVLLGLFLGFTIRLVRERRQHDRATTS